MANGDNEGWTAGRCAKVEAARGARAKASEWTSERGRTREAGDERVLLCGCVHAAICERVTPHVSCLPASAVTSAGSAARWSRVSWVKRGGPLLPPQCPSALPASPSACALSPHWARSPLLSLSPPPPFLSLFVSRVPLRLDCAASSPPRQPQTAAAKVSKEREGGARRSNKCSR